MAYRGGFKWLVNADIAGVRYIRPVPGFGCNGTSGFVALLLGLSSSASMAPREGKRRRRVDLVPAAVALSANRPPASRASANLRTCGLADLSGRRSAVAFYTHGATVWPNYQQGPGSE